MKEYEIISFHPGRQHNFEQAGQISRHFKNFKHLTSLYFSLRTVKRWSKISPKVSYHLNKRSFDLGDDVVHSFAFQEIKLLLKRNFFNQKKNSDFIKRNYHFQEWVLKNYTPPRICIGYDTSSWKVFKEWKHKSFLILDLSIAVPQYKKILADEYNFDREFILNQTEGDDDVYSIYEEETQNADLILCGSEFVKNSCISIGVNPKKLFVLPYGADLKQFHKRDIKDNDTVVKIVFIGTVNFRKGADILLKAWEQIYRMFPYAELHFYGTVSIEKPENLERVFFHGFIDRERLIAELNTADISVLPTFFEGSSLAIYQSMALGLAVITTPNSGSIIKDKHNGLIVNYGSVEGLVENLKLLITDSSLRNYLSANALSDVQDYTWDNYGDKLSTLLDQVIKKESGEENLAAVHEN